MYLSKESANFESDLCQCSILDMQHKALFCRSRRTWKHPHTLCPGLSMLPNALLSQTFCLQGCSNALSLLSFFHCGTKTLKNLEPLITCVTTDGVEWLFERPTNTHKDVNSTKLVLEPGCEFLCGCRARNLQRMEIHILEPLALQRLQCSDPPARISGSEHNCEALLGELPHDHIPDAFVGSCHHGHRFLRPPPACPRHRIIKLSVATILTLFSCYQPFYSNNIEWQRFSRISLVSQVETTCNQASIPKVYMIVASHITYSQPHPTWSLNIYCYDMDKTTSIKSTWRNWINSLLAHGNQEENINLPYMVKMKYIGCTDCTY